MSNFSQHLLQEYYGIGKSLNTFKSTSDFDSTNDFFEEESDNDQSQSTDKDDCTQKNEDTYEVTNEDIENVTSSDNPNIEHVQKESNTFNDESQNISLTCNKSDSHSKEEKNVPDGSKSNLESTTVSKSSSMNNKTINSDALENDEKHRLEHEISSKNKHDDKKPRILCNNIYLDLSNNKISKFPFDLLESMSGIKMLYLENNQIAKLPDEIFSHLHDLEWLDVRRNEITYIPKSIKGHKCLETILLEDNQIEELPLELGLVQNLKQLQLSNNPIVFPAMHIIELGFKAIINFLREEWNREYPEAYIEISLFGDEMKPTTSTILCYQEKPLMKRYTKFKSKIPTEIKQSSTNKRWNYRMGNRCDSKENSNDSRQRDLLIRAARNFMIKRHKNLQKILDEQALNEWRRTVNRKNYTH